MKKIVRFEHYSIDEAGNVFNNKNKQIKPSLNNKGYLRLSLSKDSKKYCFSVHRLVAEHFIPNPDNLPQVNHIDGNKQNNHFSNLEWCTNKENIRHAIANGLADYRRDTKGIKNGNSKLSLEEVEIIRNSNEKNVNLAKQYNVSSTLIGLIKSKKRW